MKGLHHYGLLSAFDFLHRQLQEPRSVRVPVMPCSSSGYAYRGCSLPSAGT
jgi:hypothetical protein